MENQPKNTISKEDLLWENFLKNLVAKFREMIISSSFSMSIIEGKKNNVIRLSINRTGSNLHANKKSSQRKPCLFHSLSPTFIQTNLSNLL